MGAGAYLLHDLGKAQSSERVAFTHTVNMLTDDPDRAVKVMAWTAAHAHDLKQISGQVMTGRQAKLPVYHYSLAWAPDQNPTRAEMIAFGLRSMKALGVEEHEALFVAHDDTPHRHLHVMLNRVHPVTGLMAKMDHDQNRLSRLAQALEMEDGHVYCATRVANNDRRNRGEKVKAVAEERQSSTAAYKQQRAERIKAQRQAAALAHARLKAEADKATAARDLRADFDRAAARDDRQYRVREIERPPADEAREARAAWAEETDKARTVAKQAQQGREAQQAQQARREGVRRCFLDDKRAERWRETEARHLQAQNDKETRQREALYDHQAATRARFEGRLQAKYAPTELAIERRIAAITAQSRAGGVRGLLGRLTGKQAQNAAQLAVHRAARTRLEVQKGDERQGLDERHATQRAVLQTRQASDRARLIDRMQAIKSRQDAAFAKREEARAARLATAAPLAAQRGDDAHRLTVQAQREAARPHVRAVVAARAQRADHARATGQTGRPGTPAASLQATPQAVYGRVVGRSPVPERAGNDAERRAPPDRGGPRNHPRKTGPSQGRGR